MKIKKGDEVIVIKGSDKNKVGKVLGVLENKVIVEGVNVRTLHQKPKTKDEKGSIVKKEMPVSASNVSIFDPKEKKPTRVGYSGEGKDKKRVTKKSGTNLAKAKSSKKKAEPKKKEEPKEEKKSKK